MALVLGTMKYYEVGVFKQCKPATARTRGRRAMSDKFKASWASRSSDAGRFVTFSAAGVNVDIDRYLRTPKGKKALTKVDDARKKFKNQKQSG